MTCPSFLTVSARGFASFLASSYKLPCVKQAGHKGPHEVSLDNLPVDIEGPKGTWKATLRL